jgi:hypothetical protein
MRRKDTVSQLYRVENYPNRYSECDSPARIPIAVEARLMLAG